MPFVSCCIPTILVVEDLQYCSQVQMIKNHTQGLIQRSGIFTGTHFHVRGPFVCLLMRHKLCGTLLFTISQESQRNTSGHLYSVWGMCFFSVIGFLFPMGYSFSVGLMPVLFVWFYKWLLSLRYTFDYW